MRIFQKTVSLLCDNRQRKNRSHVEDTEVDRSETREKNNENRKSLVNQFEIQMIYNYINIIEVQQIEFLSLMNKLREHHINYIVFWLKFLKNYSIKIIENF